MAGSLCRVTKDVDTWHQLAALLPPAEAEEIRGCWNIGEQEAGLGLLVSGILANDVAISELVRARISVLTETWGEREALASRILRCRSDGRSGAAVRLVEQEGALVSGDTVAADQDLAGLVLAPWIECTRCDQILLRVHVREAWGGLSYLAEHYAIAKRGPAPVARLFPADSAEKAFDSLLRCCRRPSPQVTAQGLEP